ncbi:hypothetical protein [Sulfitobacter sp.]|uniref:hypothetical protein n=1 Tax=Sulfitobacter sp. TaxID=1903071 RepID=UPI0035648957
MAENDFLKELFAFFVATTTPVRYDFVANFLSVFVTLRQEAKSLDSKFRDLHLSINAALSFLLHNIVKRHSKPANFVEGA